jgi:hypothetical protein
MKIDLDKGEFIGEGKWYKNSTYQVYKVDGKYYAVVVVDQQNLWLMENTIEEITEEEIVKYI